MFLYPDPLALFAWRPMREAPTHCAIFVHTFSGDRWQYLVARAYVIGDAIHHWYTYTAGNNLVTYDVDAFIGWVPLAAGITGADAGPYRNPA